jgi:hypothetical protein
MNFWQTLLLGLIAALIGFFLQRRSWQHQYLVKLRDEERSQAIDLSNRIFMRLDKRLSLQRSFVRLSKGDYVGDSQEFLRSYHSMLDEWNGELFSNAALLKHWFGQTTSDYFISDIHTSLRKNSDIAARLLHLGYQNLSTKHKAESDGLLQELTLTSRDIRIWMDEVTSKIENGRFGRTQYINSLNAHDASLVSSTYLLKRLLNFPRTTV